MTAVRSVMSLAVAEIGELSADQYVGLIDDSAVECLTTRLAAERLLTPIWVRCNGNAAKMPWSVIAGRHRLLAAKRLGWTKIDAVQHADASSNQDALRALQVAENLDRRVLRPIERSINIMCRWHNIAATKSWDIVSHAREVDEETAAACGVGDRTIRRFRRLHESIVVPFPDLFARLNAHPGGEKLSDLTRIATIADPIVRRGAIMAILEPASNPTPAPQVVPQTRFGDSIITNWARLGVAEKRTRAEQMIGHSPDTVLKHIALKSVERIDVAHCADIARQALLKMSADHRMELLATLGSGGNA